MNDNLYLVLQKDEKILHSEMIVLEWIVQKSKWWGNIKILHAGKCSITKLKLILEEYRVWSTSRSSSAPRRPRIIKPRRPYSVFLILDRDLITKIELIKDSISITYKDQMLEEIKIVLIVLERDKNKNKVLLKEMFNILS